MNEFNCIDTYALKNCLPTTMVMVNNRSLFASIFLASASYEASQLKPVCLLDGDCFINLIILYCNINFFNTIHLTNTFIPACVCMFVYMCPYVCMFVCVYVLLHYLTTITYNNISYVLWSFC